MRGCPELSKLPKAPARISSLHFRRQTPGSVAQASFQKPTPAKRLDPRHPIDRIPGKQNPFIWATSKAFTLGAVHMGLILKPPSPPNYPVGSFDSWDARVARGAQTGTVAPMILNDPRPHRLSMSLQLASSSSVRTYQRVQILRRFKTALNLIATRNADVKEVNGRLLLMFDEKGASEDWILQGWSYHLRASLELYSMSYPELVGHLRPALRDLWTRGTEMEAQWVKASIGSTRGLPTPPDARERLPRSDTTARARSPKHGKVQAGNANTRQAFGLRPDNVPPTIVRDAESSLKSKRREPRVTPALPLEPDFDPFPSVRAEIKPTSATLPVEPDFDPFPSVPAFDPFPDRATPSVAIPQTRPIPPVATRPVKDPPTVCLAPPVFSSIHLPVNIGGELVGGRAPDRGRGRAGR
ncbi:hypothetical protein B0H11DRAFT_2070092 [Mycena galericulata]|nr:hypothetical protein B0H11DRAFT_2070092 [Mycena galericulata]